VRRTNANPFFFFSRATAKKKWRLFPLSVDLRWRKRHEQRHQQKARNNAKKNNSHDNNNNTTTTSSAVPFSDALLLCAVRLFFSKAAFVLHQRATTLLRVVFLVSRVDLSEDIERTTQNCTTHNSSRLFSEERHKRLSLSVCVFLLEQQQVVLVFLSASKSSSVLRRSSFVVKGKERFKNETHLESCVQTR